MSFLKLCQLSCDFYLETCDREVLINNPQYPLILQCEVIDWESEEEFNKRGKANSFTSVEVILESAPIEIREAVYQQLLPLHSELIK